MIGVDIVLISRIEKAIKSTAFLSRVFTPSEQEYCNKKPSTTSSYAGIYASKEALAKATGRGINLAFHEIEIRHDKLGAPYYFLSGETKKILLGKKANL